MFDPTSSTRRLPLPAHVSARNRDAIERAAEALDERQHQADARRRKAADGIRKEFLGELTRLLGERGLADLEESTRRERLGLRAMMQPPAGLGVDEINARVAAIRRIEEPIRQLGAPLERLKRLQADVDARLSDVLAGPDGTTTDGYNLQGNLDRWLSSSPLHAAALPWGSAPPPEDPADPYRWFLFRPPFWGFLFGFWYQGSDAFQVERDLNLEPPTGWAGNIVSLSCHDGGFAETAQARADSQIAFAFEPAAPGILEVKVDAQCTAGTYDLSISDNFGFSAGSAEQHNYLMISVLNPLGPEQLFVRMDESHAHTDGDDLSLHNNHLTRLQHYVGDVATAGPVAAGQTVFIAVGTRSVDIGRTSRMDLQSKSEFSWLISSVEVRIVP
jgi:hypothetical protein